MKRFINLAIFAAFCAILAFADAQSDFNRLVKAYNVQMAEKQYLPAARSAASAAMICADAKNYDGGFRLLINLEKAMAENEVTPAAQPMPYYVTAKARFQLYERMKNTGQAEAWLRKMADYAKAINTKAINTDMLSTEAQYYYSVDRTDMGDKCIARLIKQYEDSNDYKDADKAYQELIDKAVSSNNAVLVERTYESYMKWSDSIDAINEDTELGRVKQEMAETQETIEKKNHTINARTGLMTIFIVLFAAAVAVLVAGALIYKRVLNKKRRMEQHVRQADEMVAQKAAQLQNMSSAMEPALEQLPQDNPAVQNIRNYVKKVEEFTEVESAPAQPKEGWSQVNLDPFIGSLVDEFKPLLKRGATIHVEGAKGYALLPAADVRRILEHLIDNAVKFAPEGGKVSIVYKKRSATTSQFIVTDDGPGIPEEERETIFTAFNSSRDISEGDGLGLPICAKRAEKIGGSLTIDPTVRKGCSFILTIHA